MQQKWWILLFVFGRENIELSIMFYGHGSSVRHIFTREQKWKINRVGKHKTIYSIADLALCDGYGSTIDSPISIRTVRGSIRFLSNEQPTLGDFKLFHTTVRNLCCELLWRTILVNAALWVYMSNTPICKDRWFTDKKQSTLFFTADDYIFYHVDRKDTTWHPTSHVLHKIEFESLLFVYLAI